MSYAYDEYEPPDGTCHDCGISLGHDPGGDHDETHRQCWACWRGDRGTEEPAWRKPRPEPGERPPSFVEGLVRVRERLSTLEKAALDAFADVERRLDLLKRRVARLERGRAA